MKIVHLSYTTPSPNYSDPEAWLKRVAFATGVPEALAKYGEQFVFYHLHYLGEITRNGVRYLFTKLPLWRLRFPVSFNRMVAQLTPDVVVVHGLIFPWQVILLKWFVGNRVKIICQHHAERPFRDPRGLVARWADRSVDAYLFASKEQGMVWVDAGQIRSVTKIHEVMGTSSIFSPEERPEARRRLGIKARHVYLWIGDLDHNKDPLLVAHTFQKFAATHEDVALYMVYQRNELEGAVRKAIGKTTAINLVGPVVHADLQSWFNAADFIVSTSHYEGSGIAVCEAISCGCVPILSDIPSFQMMTGRGAIGVHFPVGDEQALLDRLEITNRWNLTEKRQQVIDRFKTELSFEANARKIMNIIEQIS